MDKKKHTLKLDWSQEAKPDSPFFYYVKKPAGGEKSKKLSCQPRSTILLQENMKCL